MPLSVLKCGTLGKTRDFGDQELPGSLIYVWVFDMLGPVCDHCYQAVMKARSSLFASIERTTFQVCAHVRSRLLRRDINAELDRLKTLPKSRSYVEVACILGVLFALALVGASFGPWGLLMYFAVALLAFR